jgi:predicted transcriptional regulator
MSLHQNDIGEGPGERHGLKWTEEENDQLIKEVMDGMVLHEVAKNHQRTVGAIKSRIMSNALTMIKDKGLSLPDVAKLLHISVDTLNNYYQERQDKIISSRVEKIAKTKERSDESNITNNDLICVLIEIRDYLKIIAEK